LAARRCGDDVLELFLVSTDLGARRCAPEDGIVEGFEFGSDRGKPCRAGAGTCGDADVPGGTG
jgi:hypothetical protein